MNFPNRYLRIILILVVLPAISFADQFRVTRVKDGDTIKAITNGEAIEVRLVGIDAPELSVKKHLPGQPFSLKAKEHLAALILDKVVTVKSYGKDRNGQSLCEVFVKGVNINLEMVRFGYAEVHRGKPVKGLDIATYRDTEKAAKTKAVGIWELRDQYFSPKDWREMYGVIE